MPLPMQGKLLRVLQEREVERVGGTTPQRVDIRFIAATGKPIEELVGEGPVRAHLYSRLHGIPNHLPPPRAGRRVPPGPRASAKAGAERAAILAALKASGGNKSKAAGLLRIHRVKLYEKMKRHGIPAPRDSK